MAGMDDDNSALDYKAMIAFLEMVRCDPAGGYSEEAFAAVDDFIAEADDTHGAVLIAFGLGAAFLRDFCDEPPARGVSAEELVQHRLLTQEFPDGG